MFCGKVGHYAADCHKWKGQGKAVRFAQSALAAADKSGSDGGEQFVFAAVSLGMTNPCIGNVLEWIICWLKRILRVLRNKKR